MENSGPSCFKFNSYLYQQINFNKLCVKLLCYSIYDLLFLQIFDLLKATIMKSFKDSDKQRQSNWVREVVPDICHVQDYVLSTIQNR